jgi:hypothetical protein
MVNARQRGCLPHRFNIATPQGKDKCGLCIGDNGGFPLGQRRGVPDQAWHRRQSGSTVTLVRRGMTPTWCTMSPNANPKGYPFNGATHKMLGLRARDEGEASGTRVSLRALDCIGGLFSGLSHSE